MIQFLRGTQTQLNSSSQVFAAGQPIFESDSGQLKIGDGIRTFANLPYVGGSSSSTYVRVNDPNSNGVGGYIDFNDNLRLVFGKAPATFNSITSTGSYVLADYTSKNRNFGIPGNTGLIYSDDLRAMYGMRSQFFILRLDSITPGAFQCVYQCATWVNSSGNLNSSIGFTYVGQSTSAIQDVYLVLLTWD